MCVFGRKPKTPPCFSSGTGEKNDDNYGARGSEEQQEFPAEYDSLGDLLMLKKSYGPTEVLSDNWGIKRNLSR